MGYLYNDSEEGSNDQDDIEALDGIFFWVFVATWIVGQFVFAIIGYRIKNFELKKLSMGTEELEKVNDEQDDGANNYGFSTKAIPENELDKLNHLQWVTLLGKKKV